MAGGPLLDVGRVGGLLDGPLHGRVGAVVAADRPAARVLRERRRGKDVLPPPLGCRVRILFREGIWQVHIAHPVGAVVFVLGLHLLEVAPERAVEALGQHRRPVRAAFPVPDVGAAGSNIEFFDPEAKGFGQPEAAAVEQVRDQAIRAGREGREELPHLLAREHRGEAFGAVGAVEQAHGAKLQVQHVFVEEGQGAV